jgi:hypothetical protein
MRAKPRGVRKLSPFSVARIRNKLAAVSKRGYREAAGRVMKKIKLVCEAPHTGLKSAPLISAMQEKVSKTSYIKNKARRSCTHSLQPMVLGSTDLRRARSELYPEWRIQ